LTKDTAKRLEDWEWQTTKNTHGNYVLLQSCYLISTLPNTDKVMNPGRLW
jgi:hypothetical protein